MSEGIERDPAWVREHYRELPESLQEMIVVDDQVPEGEIWIRAGDHRIRVMRIWEVGEEKFEVRSEDQYTDVPKLLRRLEEVSVRPEDITIAETAGWKPTGADPAAPKQEFYKPPAGPQLGRPEDDPPFTVRMQPPWTWERRYDPYTPRAVLTDNPWSDHRWQVVSGTRYGGPLNLANDDIRDWPIQHPGSVAAAMAKLRPQKLQELRNVDLQGDMGVEAFKGGVDE